jgi:hypothetical protein
VRINRLFAIAFTVVISSAALAQSQTRPPPVILELNSRAAAFGGAALGDRGVYETLTGVAHMMIDPQAPANRGIVDLGLAPRDALGWVHYDVDVVILRPRDPKQARRVLVYDVVNRGSKLISQGGGGAPGVADAGAMYLARRGFTVVWSGWQGDLPQGRGIGARFPVATDHGRPVTGRIAPETIFDAPDGDRITLPYPAASLNQVAARLSVRQRQGDPERFIATADWHYEDDGHIALKRPENMDAGAIYRFSYVARDPKVMGLGFASVRELIAFLRHGAATQGNPLADIGAAPCERDATGTCANPGGGVFNTTVAFGISQSGRYLRDFLWQGFNRDLNGGRVFDGMMPIIAGGRRTYTNLRFAQPGSFSRQHEDHDVPGFDFPFTYGTMRDSVTGKTDGILSRCTADKTCPKLIHVDTSGEFWQAGSSLVGTGGTDHDVVLPANVRAFMLTGGTHAPGMVQMSCQSAANPLGHTPVTQALVIDLIDWAAGRQDPPASRWPRVSDGTLVPLASLKTPDLHAIGVTWPTVVNAPQSPAGTRGWPVLVPSVDGDGNDVAGVRLPEMVASVATYVGWNLRKAGFAPGELCSLFGSYFPFAKDAVSRGSDPRPSLAERYGETSRENLMNAAAAALRRDRLLLGE